MPDRHSTSWANPCWICGRVNSHDHTTAEWTAAEWAVTAALDALAAEVKETTNPYMVFDDNAAAFDGYEECRAAALDVIKAYREDTDHE